MTDTVKKAVAVTPMPDCPFCGGSLGIALDPLGLPLGLVHGVPGCHEVRTMDPAAFIMAARRKANPEWPAPFHDHLDTCDVCTDDGGWCPAGLALLGGKQ